MNISLKFLQRYVDLPEDLTYEQIAYDLTMRTVEVENIVNTADKFHDIVVGEIKEVKAHPNADALKICMVDVGEDEIKQIVCGGSNLTAGHKVCVSKPGAEVVWHGEGEPVLIKESKLRGEKSYGMICGATEVYLADIFPPADEREIVDFTELGVEGLTMSSLKLTTSLCPTDLICGDTSVSQENLLLSTKCLSRMLLLNFHRAFLNIRFRLMLLNSA